MGTDLNIGHATAYAYAKSKGYTGTEEQFATELAQFAQNAQKVAEDRAAVEQLVDEFLNTTAPAVIQDVTDEGTSQVERVADAGTAQVTRVGQAGDAQIDAVGAAGTTQIGLVTAEGTTQVTRVQDKGDEVIDSIPADYTALTQEVSDLNQQTSELKSTFDTAINLPFNTVVGSINGDGIIVSSNEGYRATDGIYVKTGDVISFSYNINDAQSIWMAYALYDDTNTFKSRVVLANSVVGDSFNFDIIIPSGVAYIIFTYPYVEGAMVKILKVTDVTSDSIKNTYAYNLSIAVAKESTINILDNVLWVKGSVNSSTGIPVSSGNIIRTAKYIPIQGCSAIDIKRVNATDVYYYRVFYYDNNLTYISGNTSWVTTDLTSSVPDGSSFALIILYNNTQNAIAPSEGIHLSADGIPKIVDQITLKDDVLIKLENARHIASNTIVPLTILHFSDIHQDTDSLNSIVNDALLYSKNIDDMICTGDMCANDGGAIASWWNPEILTCIGNHDSATYSGGSYNWTGVSMAQRDSWYIAPFETNWSINHTSGTSYYYKDYITQKVRLIVMDVMLYTGTPGADADAQNTWLENLLADAITNNLHVLIAIHAPHGGASAFNCSFTRYGQGAMPTLTDCNTPQNIIDTVANAITNGLHFIGYLVGHTHQDNMWIADSAGKQIMYCVTCAAVSQKAQWEDSDQERSLSLNAFNLVTIDTANTLIKIVRGGGADIDNHMRTRKAICFNYSTGEKVGEVL